MSDVILGDRKWRCYLLELCVTGQLSCRVAPRLIQTLIRLTWVYESNLVVNLNSGKRHLLEEVLDLSCPGWRHYIEFCNGDYSEQRLREAIREFSCRHAATALVPGRTYNEKTVSALTGKHSKSKSLTDKVTVVTDFAARIRPNKGLVLVDRYGIAIETSRLLRYMCEISICERSIRDGLTVSGTMPRAILIVENLGAYMDVEVRNDVLVILGSGNAYNGALGALSLFSWTIPVFWFGDLDPKGVLIRQAFISQCRNPVQPVIPPFWSEYIDGFSENCKDGWQNIDVASESNLVETLASKRLWLEQEPVAVDSRFKSWFAGVVDDSLKS